MGEMLTKTTCNTGTYMKLYRVKSKNIAIIHYALKNQSKVFIDQSQHRGENNLYKTSHGLSKEHYLPANITPLR